MDGMVMIIMIAAAYLIPAIIASCRRHHQAGAIWAVNILAGWSVIGWVIAFIWSVSAVRDA